MIEIKNLSKTFSVLDTEIEALNEVSLTIEDGDIFGIIGLSGAGKSTLVRCIDLLETTTSGEILFDGVNILTLSKKELREKRRKISMIFQNFNLFSQRTVLKNICYPLEITGVGRAEAEAKARDLLKIVELSDKEEAYPSQLSGGQKQRVAIARALATSPSVLLCDEATSALDPNTTSAILDLLKRINRELDVTVVIITHEMNIVRRICNKVAVMNYGEIVEQGYVNDVFIAPKSDIARDLILSRSKAINEKPDGKILKLTFEPALRFEPVMSNLVLICNSAVNILKADVNSESSDNSEMVIRIPSDAMTEQRVFTYLNENGISFEEAEE